MGTYKLKNFFLICIFLSIVILDSCIAPQALNQKDEPQKAPIALTMFSDSVIIKYDLSAEDLMNLQYWNGSNGQEIVLKKTSILKEDTVIDGRLKTIDITTENFIKIKPFTKAKLIDFDKGIMYLTFEENDSNFLVFGPNKKGEYILYTLKGSNYVMYGDQTFQVMSGGNGAAKLFFNFEQIKRVETNEKIIPGIKVN